MVRDKENELQRLIDEMKFRWMRTEVSYNRWAASFGLTLNELWLLWLLSGKENGLRQSDLVTTTTMSKQTVSYAIKQLERKGYVERGIETEDKRGRTAKITERGEAAFSPILQEIDVAGLDGLGEFSAQEQHLFVKMHSKYVDGVVDSFTRFAARREAEMKRLRKGKGQE